MSSGLATYALGAITVFVGTVGTSCGSLLLNKYMIKYDQLHAKEMIKTEYLDLLRIEIATKIMPIGIGIGMIIATSATVFSYFFSKPANYIVYLLGILFGEFFIFITISPTAISIMGSVPNHLRGQANGVSVFVMHALGDFPSPFIIGALFDIIGKFWGMIFTTSWLFFAVLFWTLAWNIAVIYI